MRVIHICFKFQLFFPIWLFYSLKYPFKWLILVVFCCYHQVGSHRLRTLLFKKAVKFLFICSTAHRSYLREPNIFRRIIEPKKRKKEKRTRNERKNFNRNSTQLFLNMVLIWTKTKLRTCQQNENNHSNSNNTPYKKKNGNKK